jgi:hypothetical protein
MWMVFVVPGRSVRTGEQRAQVIGLGGRGAGRSGRLHLSADAVEAPREQRHEDHEQER